MTDLYCSEDAQQILKIAIDRQAEAGELTRSQLFEIAAELNISAADLMAAEQEWLVRSNELEERNQFIRLRQSRFHGRLAKYLIVNAFLLVLNLVTGGSWILYIAIPWGIGVALDAWRTYRVDAAEFDEAFQHWRQRQQIKRSVSTVLSRFNQWIAG
ncbi:hypothetical protein C7B76_08495 [filamentous cyanobacterium CCP2]|nr:hypothetical protein C7B76_08495 [filamentous cyanobacterium CCP2]